MTSSLRRDGLNPNCTLSSFVAHSPIAAGSPSLLASKLSHVSLAGFVQSLSSLHDVPSVVHVPLGQNWSSSLHPQPLTRRHGAPPHTSASVEQVSELGQPELSVHSKSMPPEHTLHFTPPSS